MKDLTSTALPRRSRKRDVSWSTKWFILDESLSKEGTMGKARSKDEVKPHCVPMPYIVSIIGQAERCQLICSLLVFTRISKIVVREVK